jgi:hypothetical protein
MLGVGKQVQRVYLKKKIEHRPKQENRVAFSHEHWNRNNIAWGKNQRE